MLGSSGILLSVAMGCIVGFMCLYTSDGIMWIKLSGERGG